MKKENLWARNEFRHCKTGPFRGIWKRPLSCSKHKKAADDDVDYKQILSLVTESVFQGYRERLVSRIQSKVGTTVVLAHFPHTFTSHFFPLSQKLSSKTRVVARTDARTPRAQDGVKWRGT